MQSSAVVTLRAVVMLLCLVLVPLAAIFGSSLPRVFESLVQGRGIARVVSGGREIDDSRLRGGDAPVFAGSGPPESRADEPVAGGSQGTGSLWAPGAVLSTAADGHRPIEDRPAVDSSAASSAPRMDVVGIAGERAPAALPANRGAGVAKEGFSQIEHRLRELGAAYYLLETWGKSGELYRFHCKVSVAGNPHHTRHFDATDDDPVRAMSRVLEQVEQFRAGAIP